MAPVLRQKETQAPSGGAAVFCVVRPDEAFSRTRNKTHTLFLLGVETGK